MALYTLTEAPGSGAEVSAAVTTPVMTLPLASAALMFGVVALSATVTVRNLAEVAALSYHSPMKGGGGVNCTR